MATNKGARSKNAASSSSHQRWLQVFAAARQEATMDQDIHQAAAATPPPQPPPVYCSLFNPQLTEVQMEQLDGEQIKEETKKKRHRRTNLSTAQKDRMREFAKKLGWTAQGHQDKIHQFCFEIGIAPRVLKVWINNNKCKTRTQQVQITRAIA